MDIGESLKGTFAGVEARLDAVPVEILEGEVARSFDEAVITVADATFRVIDRNGDELDRYEPLIARDASVTVDGDIITAQAMLRQPLSDRVVAGVDISHNLATANGNAAISIENLVFGEGLQPQATLDTCYCLLYTSPSPRDRG